MRKTSYILTAGLVAGCLPFTAYAADDLSEADNIVVTAARFSQPSLEAPANVAVVTAEDMNDIGAVRIGDALTGKVPGLYMRGDLVGTTPRLGSSAILSIRGLSQDRVKVLIDGMQLNDANSGGVNGLSGVLTGDIQRIEVVPGVGSALYGSDALGGVINIITVVPTRQEFYGRFVKGFNENRKEIAEVIVRDRLSNGIGYMIGFDREVFQGFPGSDPVTVAVGTTGTGQTVATGGRLTRSNKGDAVYEIGHKGAVRSSLTNATTKLFADINATSRLTLGFNYNRTESTVGKKGYESFLKGANGNPLPVTAANVSINGDRIGTLRENQFWQSSLPLVREEKRYFAVYDGDFTGGIRTKIDLAYTDRDYSYVSAGTGATNSNGPGTQVSAPNESFFANAQFMLPTMGAHNVIVGFTVLHATLDRKVEQVSNWRAPDYSGTGILNEVVDGKTTTKSIYVQDKIDATEQLAIYLGARFDHWTTSGVTTKFTGTPLGTTTYPERSDSAFSPKVALVYRPTDTLTVRSSLGMGFRAPALFDMYSAPSSSSGRLLLPDPFLNPERTLSGDLGVEKLFAGGRRLRAPSSIRG